MVVKYSQIFTNLQRQNIIEALRTYVRSSSGDIVAQQLAIAVFCLPAHI